MAEPAHPLKNFMDQKNWSARRAAKEFECAGSTLLRIIEQNRPPSPKVMQRMIDVSDGELLPNDFYKLPTPSDQTAA